MTDFISDLASESNVNPEKAQMGFGAILAFIKNKLPADAFSKVSAAVPGAEGMISAFQSAPETSGGVMDAVKGAVGKLFGGGEIISKLSKLGFSTEQLASFIPKVLEFLKSELPADVMKQITGLLPVPEHAEA